MSGIESTAARNEHEPISTGVMSVLSVVCGFAIHTRHAMPVIWLTLAYFVLWFAYVPRLPTMPNGFDLSYGVYLWAWPVQQCVVMTGYVHEPFVLFLVAAPITIAIAALSWRYIEKPALALKDKRWFASSTQTVRSGDSAARGDGPLPKMLDR